MPGRSWQYQSAKSAITGRRGSTTMSFVPRWTACLKKVAATGWLAVVLVPVSRIRSAWCASAKTSVTAPEPMPSSSAATLDAWHRRVQ